MNHYEMVCILDDTGKEIDLPAAEEAVRAEMTKVQGRVDSIQNMGRRQLAYSINRRREGLYLVVRFLSPPGALDELRNNLKLNPLFIRNLILRVNNFPPIEVEEPLVEPPAPAEGALESEDRVNEE